MLYVIHAHPSRLWYVNNYLIPSLEAQGIDRYTVWVGSNGNLADTIECFGQMKENAWHLQDDVVVCSDFAKRTREASGVMCGFCSCLDDPRHGYVSPVAMWYSFPCIHIPMTTARLFAMWAKQIDINEIEDYALREDVKDGRGDDALFKLYMMKRGEGALNVAPNLVDHVDYMLGGSVVNGGRSIPLRAKYFKDGYLVHQLEVAIKAANSSVEGL